MTSQQDWPSDVRRGRKGVVSVNPLTRVLRSLGGGFKDESKSPRSIGTPGVESAEAQETPSRTSVDESLQESLVDDELAHNIEAAEASLLELRHLSNAARSFTRPQGPQHDTPLAAYKPGVSPRSMTSLGHESRTQGDEGEEVVEEQEELLVAPRTKSESAAREAWHHARRQRQAQEAEHAHSAHALEALLHRKAAHAHAQAHGVHTKRPPRKQRSSISQASSSTTTQLSGHGTPLSGTPPGHSLMAGMGGGPFTLGRFKAMLAHQQRLQGATPSSPSLSGGSSGQPGTQELHAAAAAEFTAVPHSRHALPTKSKTFSLPNAGSMASSQDSATSHPPLPSKYAQLQLRTDAPALAHTHSPSPTPSPSAGFAPSPSNSGSLPPPLFPRGASQPSPGAPLSPLATRRMSNSSTILPAVRRTSLSMPGIPSTSMHTSNGGGYGAGYGGGYTLGTNPDEAYALTGNSQPLAPSRWPPLHHSATHGTVLPDLAPPKPAPSLSRPSAPPVLATSGEPSVRSVSLPGGFTEAAQPGLHTPALAAEGSYMQATASSLHRSEPQHGYDPSPGRSLSRSQSRNRSARSRRGSEASGRVLMRRSSSKRRSVSGKRRLLKKNSSRRHSGAGKRRSSSGRSGSHMPHSHGHHSGPSRGSSSVGSRFMGSSFAGDSGSDDEEDGGDEQQDAEVAGKMGMAGNMSTMRRSGDGEAIEDTPLCELTTEPNQLRHKAAEHEQQLGGDNSGSGVSTQPLPQSALRGMLPQVQASQDGPSPHPLGRALHTTQQHSHAPHMAQPSPLGLAPHASTLSSQADHSTTGSSSEATTSWVHAHSHASTHSTHSHGEKDGSTSESAPRIAPGHVQPVQLLHTPTPPPHGSPLPESHSSKSVPLLPSTKHARFNLPLNASTNTSTSSSSTNKPRPPPMPASASTGFGAGQPRSSALQPGTSPTQEMNEGKLTKLKGNLQSYLAGQRMDVTRLEPDSYLYKLDVESKGRAPGRFAGNKKGRKGHKNSPTGAEGTHTSHAPTPQPPDPPSYLRAVAASEAASKGSFGAVEGQEEGFINPNVLGTPVDQSGGGVTGQPKSEGSFTSKSKVGGGGGGVGASLAAMLAGLDEEEQELRQLQARSRAARVGRPEPRDMREVEHRDKWV